MQSIKINELWAFAILAIGLTAMATDIVWGRIFNWLTAPALVAGVAVSFWLGGWSGGADALLGGLAGLILFGWMFWVGVLGGGDVKLLMAVGAWGGLRYCAGVAVLSVLLGGALAVGMLAARGSLASFVIRARRFLVSALTPQLELETFAVDRKSTMPFGIPIAAAAVWNAFGHPMAVLGLAFLSGGRPS